MLKQQQETRTPLIVVVSPHNHCRLAGRQAGTMTPRDGPLLFAVIALTSMVGCVTCLPASQFTSGNDGGIQCTRGAYPPPQNATVPTVIVNLDLPPEQRWNALIEAKKTEILELRQALVDLVGTVLDGALLKLIDKFGPSLHASLPSPYREELQSLANATGMNLGEVVLYNVFYEFFTVCTSIVAQNEQGQIIHARNLDFGLFLGWNSTSHSWSMTEVLRKNVVQLEWQRGGKTVFSSVSFAGYIGLLTAVKANTLSLTINERFNVNGGFIGLFQWIVMGKHDLKWVGFLARDIFESDMDFAQGKQALKQAKLIAPVYFILGGSKPGEGTILTKDRNHDDADDYTMEANGVKYESWYVLETNYDHWEEPPFYDDRRTTGNFCMRQMGAKNVTMANLFNVLSTQPNLNKLTAYTALMNVNTGKIETYLQKCEGDCTPW